MFQKWLATTKHRNTITKASRLFLVNENKHSLC